MMEAVIRLLLVLLCYYSLGTEAADQSPNKTKTNAQTPGSVTFRGRQLLHRISREVSARSVEDNDTCPPWFLPETDSNGSIIDCHCPQSLEYIVRCSEETQESSVAIGYCMSYDSVRQDTVVGRCPHSIHAAVAKELWVHLPQNVSELNSSFCGPLNREGLLCGQCKPGFGLSLYSPTLDCVDCRESKYGVVWFILSAFILPTVLFAIIVIFRISATSAALNAFILFSHIVAATYAGLFLPKVIASYNQSAAILAKVMIAFYYICSLDFFTTFLPTSCLREEISTLNAIALGYISAFFPIVLIGATYLCIELHDHNFKPFVWVWKPFHKCFVKFKRFWDLRKSVIHAFTTFLLLSYTKVTFVSVKILSFTALNNATGHRVGPYVWYQDASVELFSTSHIPYGLVAIFILATYVLLPPILLFLYPFKTFRKLLRKSRLNCLALHTFMDAFHGCFKDGTTGTRDYRHFAAFYFLLRICYVGILLLEYLRLVAVGFFISAALLVAVLKPYKKRFFNILDMLTLTLLALIIHLYVVLININLLTNRFSRPILAAICVLLSLPLLYLMLFSIYYVARSTRITQKCWKFFPKALSTFPKHTETHDLSYESPSFDSLELPHRITDPAAYESYEED